MSNSEKISLLEDVCYNYKNGLLIVDGFNELKSENVNHLGAINAMLTINRTPQRDCIIVFGDSYDNVTTRFIQNGDYVRLHGLKTFDKVRCPNPQLFEIAKSILLIKKKHNIYNHIFLDMANNKIFGLSEKVYVEAVKNYIYETNKN